MFTQVTRYGSPTRTSDGRGGFTLAVGTGTLMWGVIQVHQGERQLVARKEATVNTEDIIEVDDQYYRVVGKLGHQSGPYQTYAVEATQRPIVP